MTKKRGGGCAGKGAHILRGTTVKVTLGQTSLEESLSITIICCDLAIATHARKMLKYISV